MTGVVDNEPNIGFETLSASVVVFVITGSLKRPSVDGVESFKMFEVVPNEIGPLVAAEVPKLIPDDSFGLKTSPFGNEINEVGADFLAPGFGLWQQAHVSLSASLLTKHVSQDHLLLLAGCLLNKELLGAGATAAGLLLGLGVMQQAHLSFISAFETRQVSQFHLGPCEVETFLKRDDGSLGAAAVVVGVEVVVVAVLDEGLGVEQQAHLSMSSGLDTRQVSHDHLETVGWLKIDAGLGAVTRAGGASTGALASSVACVCSTIGLLQLEHTEALAAVSTSNESVVVFGFFTGVSKLSGLEGNIVDLFGEVFIQRQLRHTIFKLSFE